MAEASLVENCMADYNGTLFAYGQVKNLLVPNDFSYYTLFLIFEF